MKISKIILVLIVVGGLISSSVVFSKPATRLIVTHGNSRLVIHSKLRCFVLHKHHHTYKVCVI